MIALLLGSFNPVHNGHTAIARYTIEQGLAEEVWFVVSPQNPLKSPADLAPLEDRIEMVRLAISGQAKMSVCDIEATLPYPSYTINTLRALHKQYPDKEFVILAGSDIKAQLPQWREYEEVERLARFLIYPRGEQRQNCSPEMANAPLIEIDSTLCRKGLDPLSPLVEKSLDNKVLEYIYTNKLYAMKTIKDYDWLIATEPRSAKNHYERGMLYYKNNEFGRALNDFNAAIEIKPTYKKALQMKEMAEAILDYRKMDLYNV